MCGLVGIVGKTDIAPDIYDALTVLQHRGQDAAGIMTCSGGRFSLRKSEGLVRDVFRQQHMLTLQGSIGIGHVRYPTAGSSGTALAQCFANDHCGFRLPVHTILCAPNIEFASAAIIA